MMKRAKVTTSIIGSPTRMRTQNKIDGKFVPTFWATFWANVKAARASASTMPISDGPRSGNIQAILEPGSQHQSARMSSLHTEMGIVPVGGSPKPCR
jgi:hypothetical protein